MSEEIIPTPETKIEEEKPTSSSPPPPSTTTTTTNENEQIEAQETKDDTEEMTEIPLDTKEEEEKEEEINDNNPENTPISSSSSSSSSSSGTTRPKKKIHASLTLIGTYQPATFINSPPPPPEGYILTPAEWDDLLDGSRKMKLVLEGRANTKAGDFVTTYGDIADEGDDARSATGALEKRRKAELEARAQQEQPTSFWGRAKASMGAAFSSVAYAMNRVVAYVQDESKRESRERSARRFEALNLNDEQRAAAGALLTDFYCRAVVRAPQKLNNLNKQKNNEENDNNEKIEQKNNGEENEKVSESKIFINDDDDDDDVTDDVIIKRGKAAAGWMYLTEHWLIFDGDIVTLPGDAPDEDDVTSNGHVRFIVWLNRVASFTGAVWRLGGLENVTGEVPEFVYSERRERQVRGEECPYKEGGDEGNAEEGNAGVSKAEPDAEEDAIVIFDQRGAVHQFWDFNSQFGGNAFSMLCTFNNVWRNAMLGV